MKNENKFVKTESWEKFMDDNDLDARGFMDEIFLMASSLMMSELSRQEAGENSQLDVAIGNFIISGRHVDIDEYNKETENLRHNKE